MERARAIFIVDTAPTTLEGGIEALEKAGFRVLTSRDGESALPVIRQTLPDVILLNVALPGIDGFETCRQLKQDDATREIPVIFMAALANDDDEIRGLELGAVDYIAKPIRVKIVLARVRTHLALRHLQQEREARNQQLHRQFEERQHIEHQVRKLSRAVDQSASTIVITDTRGTIEFVNPAFSRTTGYSYSEAIGQNPRIMQSGAHSREFYRKLWKTIRNGNVWHGEFVNRKKNGDLYWEAATISPVKDPTGKIINYLAVKEDITERKLAQEMLARERNLLHIVIDNIPDFIYAKDAQGRFMLANTAGIQSLNCSSLEELVGKTDRDLFPEELARRFQADEQRILTSGQPLINQEEFSIDYRTGDAIWVLTTKIPLRDSAGKITGLVGINRNITTRKQKEDAIKEAKEAADSANRAKSEFLANMSHELRTPLNGVLGYAQILKRDPTLSASQRHGLDIIERSGEHLLNLINGILDLSKIEARRMELYPSDIHFRNFLQGMMAIVEIRAQQKQIAFRYELAPNLPDAVLADQQRLGQILLNLLNNAIKFTEQGSVTFRVTNSPGQGYASLRFEVEDTGVGISSDKLDVIFAPFRQVGANAHKIQGTGLGLTISQRLAELMGSVILVESEPGRGSRFWFEVRLPEVSSSLASHYADFPKITGFRGTCRALVIDDSPENRDVLRDMLSPLGFDVQTAATGQDGIALTLAQQPDVVFTDLMLPDINGADVVREIRRHAAFGQTVMIAVSASVFGDVQQRMQDVGCQAFLPKPIRYDALLHLLKTHLRLEWLHETDHPTDGSSFPHPDQVVFPPLDDMTTLYDLAKIGDIFGVEQFVNALAERNQQYLPFVLKILAWRKSLNILDIQQFLRQRIEKTSAP